MIAAISLMQRRQDVTLAMFRRHWLDVHGPLVCGFPALRRYVIADDRDAAHFVAEEHRLV